MLEANHTLNKDDIVDIFSMTARKDAFTGSIGSMGNNLWGFGKVDALATVAAAEDYTGISNPADNNPNNWSLDQNYPNPFNSETTISFKLKVRARISIKIYNILGQVVRDLANTPYSAGQHSLNFNAAGLTSGIYFYKIKCNGFEKIRKMVLME
jgi:hypothetical protein